MDLRENDVTIDIVGVVKSGRSRRYVAHLYVREIADADGPKLHSLVKLPTGSTWTVELDTEQGYKVISAESPEDLARRVLRSCDLPVQGAKLGIFNEINNDTIRITL
jgi:hypothetical protein